MAPLWLDETLSYWQVSGGFGKVWTRSALMPSSIGYLYTLWFAKSILRTNEIALKIPSTLALLAAVYFLFRVARELFGQEIAFLTCIFFCLEGNVVFASTDARPYAFAMLATAVASLAFVRWMKGHEMRPAIWFGAAAASVLYFHYLFATILPVQSLPQPTRSHRAGDASPGTGRIRHTGNAANPDRIRNCCISRCAGSKDKGSAALLIPAGILIIVSTVTSARLLIPRYLSVAAPGSALFWALLTSRIDSSGSG